MLVCIMGPTCCGKSTLIGRLLKEQPNKYGAIEVGKEMRKRHPPEYFTGLAAMPHTEEEVWQIFVEQYQKQMHKSRILVDGQPRLASQVQRLIAFADAHNESLRYIFLTVTQEEIMARLLHRFPNDAPSQALGFARSKNDCTQLWDVVVELTRLKQYPLFMTLDQFTKEFDGE